MTRGLSVAPLLVLAGCLAMAQQRPPSNGLPILLPPGVPSETVNIMYVLEGSFGSHGAQVRPKPNLKAYFLPFSIEKTGAARIRALIWAPGCEFRTYDIAIQESPSRQIAYECALLTKTTLTGRIREASLVSERPYELEISYSAFWRCDFFGLGDCLTTQLPIATVTPAADGRFQTELPDFSRDPVIAKFRGPDDRIENFQMILRNPKTLNPLAELQPEMKDLRSTAGKLRILSTYPSDVAFLLGFTMR
jgi:hypothetical protein